ncbi:MAG: TetR/AcrR family transcriptional regulator [Solirubrobacteraceae bacterium]|jgi:AcrR family transcriptional regulator
MAVRPSARQEQQERTRSRLLEAAARVFGRRGYHAATLEEVAREAGYSTGAVYSNFAGKEDLFLALADQQVADRIAEAQAVIAAADTPERLGDEVAKQFRAFIERDPQWPLLFFEFWSYGVRNPPLRDEFDHRRRAVRGAVAEALQRAARTQDREVRYPPHQLAAVVMAVINGLAFERVADPAAIPDQLFAWVLAVLLEAALTPGDAEAR